MNKIAIFGLGAIGSVLTKYLKTNKHNQLCYFNRSHKSTVGIVFNNQLVNLPIKKINQNNAPYDWIIVCLKTYHLAEAKRSIKRLIGPKTKIGIFRNGLDLTAEFKSMVPVSNILETIIDCPTQLNSDGNYLQLKLPNITLPESSLAKEFKELFFNSKIQIQFTKSFKKTQWKKLIESSSIGALQVLTGKPCVIFKDQKMVDQYRRLVIEGIIVANKDGANIRKEFADELLEKLKTYPDHKGSSMLSDKLAGRPLELNAKIGIIVKVGEKNNLDIPISKKIFNGLKLPNE